MPRKSKISQPLGGFAKDFSSVLVYYCYFYPSEMLPIQLNKSKGNFYKIFLAQSCNICTLSIAEYDKILALVAMWYC